MLKIFLLFLVTSRASAGPDMWDFLSKIFEGVKDSVTSGARDATDYLSKPVSDEFLAVIFLLGNFRETMLYDQDCYLYYNVANDYASPIEPDYRINDVYDYTRQILYDAGEIELAAEDTKEFRGVVDKYLDDMRVLGLTGL